MELVPEAGPGEDEGVPPPTGQPPGCTELLALCNARQKAVMALDAQLKQEFEEVMVSRGSANESARVDEALRRDPAGVQVWPAIALAGAEFWGQPADTIPAGLPWWTEDRLCVVREHSATTPAPGARSSEGRCFVHLRSLRMVPQKHLGIDREPSLQVSSIDGIDRGTGEEASKPPSTSFMLGICTQHRSAPPEKLSLRFASKRDRDTAKNWLSERGHAHDVFSCPDVEVLKSLGAMSGYPLPRCNVGTMFVTPSLIVFKPYGTATLGASRLWRRVRRRVR